MARGSPRRAKASAAAAAAAAQQQGDETTASGGAALTSAGQTADSAEKENPQGPGRARALNRGKETKVASAAAGNGGTFAV